MRFQARHELRRRFGSPDCGRASPGRGGWGLRKGPGRCSPRPAPGIQGPGLGGALPARVPKLVELMASGQAAGPTTSPPPLHRAGLPRPLARSLWPLPPGEPWRRGGAVGRLFRGAPRRVEAGTLVGDVLRPVVRPTAVSLPLYVHSILSSFHFNSESSRKLLEDILNAFKVSVVTTMHRTPLPRAPSATTPLSGPCATLGPFPSGLGFHPNFRKLTCEGMRELESLKCFITIYKHKLRSKFTLAFFLIKKLRYK